MNTTAILEAISGYRRVIALYSKYVEELTIAMDSLAMQKYEFEGLMDRALVTHSTVDDFEGTKANKYFEMCDELVTDYSAYDEEIGDAIKTMSDEIINLNQKIADLNSLISQLESQLVAGD